MRAFVILPLLLVCGCSAPSGGGSDASSNASTDGGRDAGTDAGIDAGGLPPGVLASFACPITLASDATHLYALNYGYSTGQGTIERLERSTGVVETLVGRQTAVSALALSSTEVWWTGTGGGVNGSVRRAPKAAGSVNAFGTVVVPNEFSPKQIKIAANGDVYWLGDTLRRLRVGQTVPESLSTSTYDRALALDATYAYFTDDMALMARLTLGTGARVVLAPPERSQTANGPYTAHDIALDDTYVYWITAGASYDGNQLMRVKKDGTGTREVIVPNIELGANLVVDAKYAYFTKHGGTVSYVPKDGSGPAQVLAFEDGGDPGGSASAGPMVIEGTSLIWAFCLPGRLHITPLPP